MKFHHNERCPLKSDAFQKKKKEKHHPHHNPAAFERPFKRSVAPRCALTTRSTFRRSSGLAQSHPGASSLAREETGSSRSGNTAPVHERPPGTAPEFAGTEEGGLSILRTDGNTSDFFSNRREIKKSPKHKQDGGHPDPGVPSRFLRQRFGGEDAASPRPILGRSIDDRAGQRGRQVQAG